MRQGNNSTIEATFGADMVEWSRTLDNKAKRLVLQCINGVSSNPVEGRTKMLQLKHLILTLVGLVFRRIYICVCVCVCVSQMTTDRYVPFLVNTSRSSFMTYHRCN